MWDNCHPRKYRLSHTEPLTVLKPILHFHENPAVLAWWNTRFEPALSYMTPVRRRLFLAAAAVVVAIRKPLGIMEDATVAGVPEDALARIGVIVGLLGILWLVYRVAIAFSRLPEIIRRHPQLALHLCFWLFLVMVWTAAPVAGWVGTVMTGVAVVFPFLLWRCGYLLQTGQFGRATQTSFSDHLFYLWPAFGGTTTPYGKGYDYLARCEAKTNEELARSQLSGIKLMLLGVCWSMTGKLMQGSFYGADSVLALHGAGIPDLSDIVKSGAMAPVGLSWASIYCEFFYQVLDHAAEGHQIVGILRLFGFNVFRNTYKPLLAESILEFWNRYYYYFKEIMSTFFFMPVFMQTGKRLKNWPNVRLFAAVFSAAFVGNMYYHILKKTNLIVEGEVFEAMYSLRSRCFYCFLLASGIFVSMWRIQQRNNRPVSNDVWVRGIRMFGVWTFFSLIYIWNVRVKSGGDFVTRVEFFFNLFGLC